MKVLVINSSAGGHKSVSRALVDEAVDGIRLAHLDAAISYRDLTLDPVPHLTAGTLHGVRGEPKSETELETRARSDMLVAELKAADIIVIGVPMYNFSVPSALKAWIDHIVREGATYERTEGAPRGLLTGKRTIVAESSGGVYRDGPRRSMDFQEPYLRTILEFVGLTDIHFVRAEGTLLDASQREAAIDQAKAELRRVVETLISATDIPDVARPRD